MNPSPRFAGRADQSLAGMVATRRARGRFGKRGMWSQHQWRSLEESLEVTTEGSVGWSLARSRSSPCSRAARSSGSLRRRRRWTTLQPSGGRERSACLRTGRLQRAHDAMQWHAVSRLGSRLIEDVWGVSVPLSVACWSMWGRRRAVAACRGGIAEMLQYVVCVRCMCVFTIGRRARAQGK